MPGIATVGATPGKGVQQDALGRRILWSKDHVVFAPGGLVIDGTNSRDLGNLAINTSYSNTDVLRCGLLMGRITASTFYAPSIIGVINAAWNGLGTTLSTTAAVAVEVARRIGASGQLRLIGCATGNTTNVLAVNTQNVAFSAINVTSGAITVTATNINCVNGGFIGVDDGSYVPRCLIGKEDGISVVDRFGSSYNAQFPEAIIGGDIVASMIINYPTDTGLKAWIKSQLRAVGYGYVFDDDF
jgi:hypothetical protein